MTLSNIRKPTPLAMNRAQRELVPLAAALSGIAGMINAIGFLAFGAVFLASPNANATVLGTNLPDLTSVSLFAGGMILSFLAGVIGVTLATHRATQFRRSLVLALATLLLAVAYLAFTAEIAWIPAILVAGAMGGIHCVFERDTVIFQEALSPSAQLIRFGEALAGGSQGGRTRRLGLHGSLWLAFAAGGFVGAASWFGLGAHAFLAAAAAAAILIAKTWLIERNLPEAGSGS